MLFYLNFAAAALSLLWALVHLFAGGKDVARPLRDDRTLDPVVRHTQYICWHFVTVTLFAMALFFALAILTENLAFSIAGTILSAGFALIGIALVPMIGASYAKVPLGWLFVPVAILGFAATVA